MREGVPPASAWRLIVGVSARIACAHARGGILRVQKKAERQSVQRVSRPVRARTRGGTF